MPDNVVKVWEITDSYWGIGVTLEEALYDCEDYGIDKDDVFDALPNDIPRSLTPAELDLMEFLDDLTDPEASERRTYREQLNRKIAAGETKGFFATGDF